MVRPMTSPTLSPSSPRRTGIAQTDVTMNRTGREPCVWFAFVAVRIQETITGGGRNQLRPFGHVCFRSWPTSIRSRVSARVSARQQPTMDFTPSTLAAPKQRHGSPHPMARSFSAQPGKPTKPRDGAPGGSQVEPLGHLLDRRPRRAVQKLDSERATEPPAAIVGLGPVVIHKDAAVAAITKDGAAQPSNVCRCFQPARSLRIELSQFLQRSILFFRQNLHTHGRRQIQGAIRGFMFFPGIQRRTVVAKTGAAWRSFRRTIKEDVCARLGIKTHHIRFTARSFHLVERPKFFDLGVQPGLHGSPIKTFVAVPMVRKAGAQDIEQRCALSGGQLAFGFNGFHGIHSTLRCPTLPTNANRPRNKIMGRPRVHPAPEERPVYSFALTPTSRAPSGATWLGGWPLTVTDRS